ncbi:MAG: putative LPS assembly protein LptD, partial [Bacteroidota bacterium]|nr:putative LPS assembly protein LptD [Bacteroidota bacterium]
MSKIRQYSCIFFRINLIILLTVTNTLIFGQNGISKIDTLNNVELDTLRKEPLILDKVIRHANGYIKINQKEKKIYMYDGAELYYQDVELKSGIIVLDYKKNEVSAGRIIDSLGNLSQAPFFKQGSDEVYPDSLRFNFKTKKAIIWNSRSDQEGMNVKASATKKQNDSVYYLKNAKITTALDVDNPEYYIRVRTAKFVPQKKMIAGLSNLYIADVPTPIFLPFAYFPMSKQRETGFIFPTIGENFNRGYFIQNGGYYFVINDNLDLAVLGDYYTNGSYGFRLENNYNKRYKFRGNFSFRYENLINSERGLPGYNKSTIFNLRWSHSKDSKSNPNSRFSSSVNLGTSSYFRESLNQINTTNFLNNTLSSSISYSRTFPKYPSVNLSLSATHSQNTRTKSVNMTLPSLTASMERIYPFVKRNAVKKGIFQNINFQYSMRGDNRINSDDETISQKGLFYGAKSGIQHNIPISTNFKIAKHFNFSLGGNYSEVWTNQTIRKFDYDLLSESVPAQDTINGFDRFSKYNYSASVGTTLYGVFNFNKQNRLQSIRHVLNANVSYSNQPGFEKYYDEYIIDAFGNTRTYSRFDGGLYGTPGNRKSSSVGITLRNTVEAKVKDEEKNDDEDFKKIKILNNLNFTTNYNIVADSLNWSPVRMSTVVPLFDNKLSLNIGATFDPYALNEEKNRKINKFSINNNGPLFRMTSANMNWGYNFSSKNNKNKERNQQSNIPGMNIKKGLDEDRNSLIKPPELEDKKEEKSTKSDLYITEIPWTLNLRHSLTYLNNFQQREISNNSIMASANVGLTPKWNINISSGYDFKNNGITYTNLGINRDLDSWEMNISWTPFGYRESWYFFIGVKSGLLRDLKYDKRREPDKRL